MYSLKSLSIRLVLAAAVLAAVSLISTDAGARTALLERSDTTGLGDALALNNPGAAHEVFGRLDSDGDVDFMSFTIENPLEVRVSIMVPHDENYKAFYPAYALIGPGLPVPETTLPFELPDGDGAVLAQGHDEGVRESLFEPFSMTRFYTDDSVIRLSLSPGQYYLAVWSPEGQVGDYALSFGDMEKWTALDFYHSIKTVSAVRSWDWGEDRTVIEAKAGEKPESKVAQCQLVVPENSRVSIPIEGYGQGAQMGVFSLKCS